MARTVDPNFIGLALDRLTNEVATMRDQLILQGTIINRMDASLGNLTVEVRATQSLLDRVLDRVRKAETRLGTLEPPTEP